MIPAGELLLCHVIGDYVLQSDWMAQEKTKHWLPALAHGVTYTLPFLLVTRSPLALLAICLSHAVIDRLRLAKYLVWAKNQASPRRYRYLWADAGPTGYAVSTPIWLATWLMIVVDNVSHIMINYGAVRWLG